MSVFKGGVPYAIDIKRLTEAYPVPDLTEGRVIRHDELAAVIEAKIGSQRYYGVINAWIKRMKAQNSILLTWQPAVGLKVQDPAGYLNHNETRHRQKIEQERGIIRNYAWVDRKRLDPIGQQRLDHQMRIAAARAIANKEALKEMAVELAPVKSLPKPKVIRESA